MFLDQAHDPGIQQLGLGNDAIPWLTPVVLPELLTQITDPSPVLNVLLPLVMPDEGLVKQNVGKWVQEIRQSPELDQVRQQQLLELLVQFILERFSRLSLQEIEKMLQLTPLEETVAGQELMQMGQVRILARIINYKFSVPQANVKNLLDPLELEDLDALSDYLLRAETYEQIEAWVDNRLGRERDKQLPNAA